MESKKRKEREYKGKKKRRRKGESVRQKFVVLSVLGCEVYGARGRWKEQWITHKMIEDGRN